MSERKISPYVTELFAIEQIGPELSGNYWIESLTEDEKRLLKKYDRLGVRDDINDLLRQQEGEKEAPPERRDLTAAQLQQAFMLKQHEEAATCLYSWGERKYPGRIDRAHLEAALAAVSRPVVAEVDRELVISCPPVAAGRRTRRRAAPSGARTSDREMCKWMLDHQARLKNEGEHHGREIILTAARKKFRVLHKVVRAAWMGPPRVDKTGNLSDARTRKST